MAYTQYNLLLKNKGFDPSPVAGKIPFWADSKVNPKAKGTRLFDEFWDEQFDRCINGYSTAGIDIPGRYYYYLNFNVLAGLYGPQYPWYVDLDLEYWKLVDQVKKYQMMGIIDPKARRKGISEKSKTILSHGLRFIDGYRGAVTAGIEQYVTGLKKKFESAEAKITDELRLNTLLNNDKTYQAGYERKDEIGGFIEDGYMGRISFETMYDNLLKLEGEYFHDVICEESGRYKGVGTVIQSIKPALMFGNVMIGTFYIQGTGGNILSTSKDFKELWDDAETYRLARFWISGARMYYPFFGNPKQTKFIDEDNGEEIDAIPNLRKYEPYQIIGCEDIQAAEDYIIRKTAELSKLTNKKRLKEHKQNNPLTVEEAFTSGGSNNFNDDKIYSTLFEIEGNPEYKEVVLDWVYERGPDNIKRRVEPLQVNFRPATKDDPEWRVMQMYQEPLKSMTDLDIGGIDGYNQDQSQTSKSLGAMIVLRQGNKTNLESRGIHKAEYPVLLYYKRPPRKEQFFEECLKVSVLYDLLRNTMCNAEQDFVIDYYIKNGGTRYLSRRPKSFDAEKSQQSHKWGAKMTGLSKPIIIGLVQSSIEDYVQFYRFPLLLRDALAYDEAYIGTDWDSIDALAYAKMRIEDMKTRPRKSNDEYDTSNEPVWKFDKEGNAFLVPNKEKPNEENINLHTTEIVGAWRSGNVDSFKPSKTNDFEEGEFDEDIELLK